MLFAVVSDRATDVDDFLELALLVASGDIKSVEELKPGQGAIMREGLSKIAVYRDDRGSIYRRSAVCPHLGCVVSWNACEGTWDCPCHGSKFTAEGRVYNGSANSDLAKVD